MACAMVTHAGTPYRSWLSSAGGVTRKRNCKRCEVKCGESAEARRWKFEMPGAFCAGPSFEFPFSNFGFCGEAPETWGSKVETGGAGWAKPSFEFPFPICVSCW